MKCRFEHDGDCCNSGATQYMCKCKKPCDTIIPLTNADRIRAMSDDELAKLLYSSDSIEWCHNLPEYAAMLDTEEGVPETKCMACLMAWLQLHAEG